jgi:formamidopyrimidine-DNA glycosylase
LPEYPDITIYIERLQFFLKDQTLQQIRIASPFFLRTAYPPLDSIKGLKLSGVERLGKRIIFVFPGEYFLVLHLMISGRLHWKESGIKIPKKEAGFFAFSKGSGAVKTIRSRWSRST